MAITLKLDESQAQALIDAANAQTSALNDLSHNLGKWLAQLTGAVEELNSTLSGSDEAEQQALINQLTADLKSSNDFVEAAIQSQPQERIE